MLSYTTAVLTKAQSIGERIKKARNILYNRVAVSLLSIFLTVLAIFMMTGALYLRNEVIITDNGNTYRIFTTQHEPARILAEQGITLSGLDSFNFEEFEKGKANLSITRSFPITLRADGISSITEAVEGETVGDVLARNNVVLAERDLVFPPISQRLLPEDQIIRVTRAFEITIYIDGESLELPVTPDGRTTVSDVLRREGLALGDELITTKNLSSLAYPGLEAEISVIHYVNRTVNTAIPYETVTYTSNLRVIGDDIIITEGIEGIERTVIIDTVVNGVVVESEVISVERVSEPVTEVIDMGAALAIPYSRRDFGEIELVNGKPVNYEYKVSGPATAYTAGPAASTASGRALEVGTVAIDPRIIPYGSLVYIVSQCGTIVYGAAVAADTGSFIHNTNVVVDVFKGLTSTSYSEAVNWGVKNVDVYVINTGIY